MTSLILEINKYFRNDDVVVYGENKSKIIKNKIVYDDDYNPILEYWKQIEKDVVNVSKKIKLQYSVLSKWSVEGIGDYYYDAKRVNHIIEFAENFCRHSKGKMAGKRVVLELWEKAMLASIFGFIDINGNRKFQKAVLIIGKKNGKSLLASIIGLYGLFADGEGGTEIYSVATKKDQAKIVWDEAKRMVSKSPTLRKRAKTLINNILVPQNDGSFKPLASDTDKMDGLNIHMVLMDEIHQWKNGRPLYDIMADGTTAREQPLVMITSTAGTIRGDIYDEIYEEAEQHCNNIEQGLINNLDERVVFFIYELDKKSEWRNADNWMKANPGIGTIKKLSALQDKAKRVNLNNKYEKNFVCKEFNIRETSVDSWLSFEDFNNTKTFDINELKPKYLIGGSDLSSTTDLTCGTVIFKIPNDEHIYVEQMYFLPEDLLEVRVRDDKIRYDIWYEQGLLRLCSGNKIDYKDLRDWFVEFYMEKGFYIPYHGYDAWSATYYVNDMEDFFGKAGMEKVIQGKKTLSAPMKNLEADLKAGRIIYNNNPILKMCIANTATDMDRNGNIQPHKGFNQRKRIDGLASLLNAYTVYERHKQEYEDMIR